MKKLILLLLFLSPLLWVINSCKPSQPDSPGPIPFTPLPKDIKDYCVFKLGSYWVYQDSMSAAYDTVNVVSYSFDTVNYKLDGKIVGTNETFKIELSHTYDGFIDGIRLFAPPPPPPYNANTQCYISLTRYKPGQVLGTTIYQIFPYTIGRPIEDNNDTVTLMHMTNTIMHYHHGFHPGYNYSVVENYHKRNVGIYRREVKSKNQVWKLIDLNIIQ